ncbi:hypothetical protein MXD81_39745 [Microbacteriaceae bacterium K1510]|nr:hypothetical protein [Microbacteriaceae bacterium K1510]
MRSLLIAAFTGLLLTMAPARAQESALPSPQLQERLIKGFLITLNDADLTKDYSVLHARLAKPWREQTSPDKLKEIFKAFADQQINYAMIVSMRPVSQEVKVDDHGVLHIRGYFETAPNRVYYDLLFMQSEDEWKPLKLAVNLKKPD